MGFYEPQEINVIILDQGFSVLLTFYALLIVLYK